MAEVQPDETTVQEAPATGVPLAGVSLPADGVQREVTLDETPATPGALDPSTLYALTAPKLNTRITANFAGETLGAVVQELLDIAGIEAGEIDEGPVLSAIRFEDEPLHVCLDRILHLVGGEWSLPAASGELSFKVLN